MSSLHYGLEAEAIPHLRLAEESPELKLAGGSIDASLLIDTQLDSGAGDMDLL